MEEKNKFLTIICLVILFLFIFCVDSFCVTVNSSGDVFDTISYDGEVIGLTYPKSSYPGVSTSLLGLDNVKGRFVYQNGNYLHVCYVLYENFSHFGIGYHENGKYTSFVAFNKDGEIIPDGITLGTRFIFEVGTWKPFTHSIQTDNGGFGFKSYNLSTSVSHIISTHNVYNRDTGELVFPAAPQKVEQVIIQEITQAEELPKAVGEVMKILIPVGLIIFGIGFLIYLVRLVISRMT